MKKPQQLVDALNDQVIALTRFHKKLLMVIADLVMLPLALWTAYSLRLSEWWPEVYLQGNLILFFILPPLGIFVFARLGLYRAIVRFVSWQAIWAVGKGVVLLACLIYLIAYTFSIQPFSRSVPIIFALVCLMYVGGSRLLVRNYYHWLTGVYTEKQSVLVYGAGYAGAQLVGSLGSDPRFAIIGFIDDDSSIWGSVVNGQPVYSPEQIAKLVETHRVEYVLLAMPSASKLQRKKILERLSHYPVHVQTVPSNREMMSGNISLENLRDIELDELLGRDPVPPVTKLIERSVKSQVVMVTGAGGSIGSEICRKVLDSEPSTLVLYEQSEFNLYQIEKELIETLKESDSDVQIVALLGSVLDKKRLSSAFNKYHVGTVYHAAAYKHVPIVERNVVAGVRNNVFGTLTAATAALEAGVSRFILISTDKAVRPTNVMGASKRLAELLLQDKAQTQSTTIFSMVRFGNVLGSSGSVVPLFKSQIKEGGPITVTHPDVVRYFMTIPEAASLVIQAGSMAQGGEVFLLDMGEPVQIQELAERMIHLTGNKIRSEKKPDGDIEIIYTGLRPGEKLYEELLLGEDSVTTEHPSIAKAEEERMPSEQLDLLISELRIHCENNDGAQVRTLLRQSIKGYQAQGEGVDYLNG
ncbi:MAG: polysaccharide biosynthesis protein [Neptuniibacter sp.]